MRLTPPTRKRCTFPIPILTTAAKARHAAISRGQPLRSWLPMTAARALAVRSLSTRCAEITWPVHASHVAFNSHGVAYVAWERVLVSVFNTFDNPSGITQENTFPSGNSEVRVTSVAPNGVVAPPVLVDQKFFGGSTFAVFRSATHGGLDLETALQGQFHDFFGLDLAVDHSGGPNDGTVYVTWDDARNKSVPDLSGFTLNPGFSPDLKQLVALFPASLQLPVDFATANPLFTSGTYAYTDVLARKSTDGVHFGPAMQVNSDQQPRIGVGTTTSSRASLQTGWGEWRSAGMTAAMTRKTSTSSVFARNPKMEGGNGPISKCRSSHLHRSTAWILAKISMCLACLWTRAIWVTMTA